MTEQATAEGRTATDKTDDLRHAVIRQLRLIRRLNESDRLQVWRERRLVRIAAWEAVQDEIDALIEFCERYPSK